MEHETMDLDQLASYLQRDARELGKLANRGHLPGQKIGGGWRFSSSEIHHWLETQLPGYSEQELTALERGPGRAARADEMLVSALMSADTTAVPLPASTRASVLAELVVLAEQSWQVYDPEALLAAVRQREDLGSTALAGGVAIPHPRRPLPDTVQGESVVAYGRTGRGIPFGAGRGGLTDIFFLVSCRSGAEHLRVLARLSRLLLRPGFTDDLRAAETAAETLRVIEAAERGLLP
jgi:PTS system nitrogen regulatory IIA component